MNPRRLLVLALALSLLAVSCSKDGNPVLPTGPGSDPNALTVSVTCTCSQLESGSTAAALLKITARRADGSAAAAGTEVTVNTNLGNFGVDAAGKPLQLITRVLNFGNADVAFFAGDKAGVANILVQSGTSVASLNLTIVDPPPVPVADFTFAQSGLSVLFSDASTGSPTNYLWRFGDGSESTERSPMHTYRLAGTYVVSLEVRNSGGTSAKSKFLDISLGLVPVAAFEFAVAGSQVNFVDKSTNDPTSWSWIFGDGNTSNLRNPIHTYATADTYTVALIATNAAGSNGTSAVVTIEAGAPPVAKFKATVNGRQVNFIDQSTGSPTSWSWNFGDGGSSTQQNPIHTYATAGQYTVLLTVSNANGSNAISDAVKIDAGTPPVAAFAFQVSGRQVNFVDKSTGNPASWLWTFGDGTTSTEQNPLHTYPAAGNYTVVLKVTNSDGSNSASEVVTIEQGTGPVAAFDFTAASNLQVNFVDRSTGSPTSWTWNLGDGSAPRFEQNPIHTYAAAGNYTVTLTVSNTSGSSNISKVVTVPPPSTTTSSP